MNATFEKRLQRRPVKSRLGLTRSKDQNRRADLRQKLSLRRRFGDARSILRNRRGSLALTTKRKAKAVLRKLPQAALIRTFSGVPLYPVKTAANESLRSRISLGQRLPIRRYPIPGLSTLFNVPMVSPAFLSTTGPRRLFTSLRNPTDALTNLPSGSTKVSPIQGFRLGVRNLQPSVSLDDVYELFSSVGSLRLCNLVRPGQAEVVYNELVDAKEAIRRYHNRELDGRPMNITLITHVSDEPFGGNRLASRLGPRVERAWHPTSFPKPLSTDSFSERKKNPVEIDMDVVRKALFNVSSGGASSKRPVDFNVSLR